MGSDELQQLGDEGVNLIGVDPVESTGTVERRVVDVHQLRHARQD
jgi:hypothetical protein